MKHFYKHLSLADKIFFVLFVVLGVLAGITGDYRGVVYALLFALGILIIAAKDITIKHQQDLIERLLEVSEYAIKALGGGKLVKTETIEFSVEKSPKKAEGNKPNEKKQRNEDTPNAGGSRSGASKERTASKTANRKGTGTASVPNRKPSAKAKNRKA